MARCENCIHDKVCDMWAVVSGIPFVNADTCEHFSPTADVAEVVRCKDCIWCHIEGFDPILNRMFGCCERPLGEYIGSVDFEVYENDFCSYGERKV